MLHLWPDSSFRPSSFGDKVFIFNYNGYDKCGFCWMVSVTSDAIDPVNVNTPEALSVGGCLFRCCYQMVDCLIAYI